ncbi:MAG: hypothetical protein ABIH26_05640 [Candidatus Eisenbacteria bacterium]
MLPRIALPLLVTLLFARQPDAADRFGPIAWSPDGETLIAYHEGRISELPFVESRPNSRTDSLPTPLALAVDWEGGCLAVSVPAAVARVDVYRRGSLQPVLSLAGLPARATFLEAKGSELLLAGPGFFERRALPEGTFIDTLRWKPPREPLDLQRGGRRETLLLGGRIVRLNGEPEFGPLPSSGEPIALTGGGEPPGLLLLDGARVLLARSGSPSIVVADLQTGERPFGALLAPGGELVLLALRAWEGSPPEPRPRVEVRNAASGDVEKRFRSARLVGGKKLYESPRAAAFDPSGRYLAIIWPLAGAQIWDTRTWELTTMY